MVIIQLRGNAGYICCWVHAYEDSMWEFFSFVACNVRMGNDTEKYHKQMEDSTEEATWKICDFWVL